MARKQPMSEKLYHRYEYLAETVATNKIFNHHKLGMEKEDVVQELKMKIFSSILKYGETWARYRDTGCWKPMPLVYYLHAALNNKAKDMINKLSSVKTNSADGKRTSKSIYDGSRISVESDSFDFGAEQMPSTINFTDNEVVINGIDLFGGLDSSHKPVFSLFIKGYSMRQIRKIFKNKSFDPAVVIGNQVSKLELHKEELYDGMDRDNIYSYNTTED